jgi:hypothetical protein
LDNPVQRHPFIRDQFAHLASSIGRSSGEVRP